MEQFCEKSAVLCLTTLLFQATLPYPDYPQPPNVPIHGQPDPARTKAIKEFMRGVDSYYFKLVELDNPDKNTPTSQKTFKLGTDIFYAPDLRPEAVTSKAEMLAFSPNASHLLYQNPFGVYAYDPSTKSNTLLFNLSRDKDKSGLKAFGFVGQLAYIETAQEAAGGQKSITVLDPKTARIITILKLKEGQTFETSDTNNELVIYDIKGSKVVTVVEFYRDGLYQARDLEIPDHLDVLEYVDGRLLLIDSSSDLRHSVDTKTGNVTGPFNGFPLQEGRVWTAVDKKNANVILFDPKSGGELILNMNAQVVDAFSIFDSKGNLHLFAVDKDGILSVRSFELMTEEQYKKLKQ